MQMHSGVAGAALFAIALALPTAAPAAVTYRTLSATFTPIGEAANVEWIPNSANPVSGTVDEIDTNGVANVLVNFDVDPELDALGDLEATMHVGGSYFSYLPEPLVQLAFSFYYAGDTPFTVGGVDYAKGTWLFGFNLGMFQYNWPNYGYTFDLGPFDGYSLRTGIAGFTPSVSSYGSLATNVLPDMVPNSHGRKYVQPGEGRWSGSVTGIYVPEPTTWALMLLGFGGMGAMLRRQRVTNRSHAQA